MIKVKKISDNFILPQKANSGDLGYDLFANGDFFLPVGQVVKITTGIAIQFPDGFGGLIKDRSSYAAKGITTSAGVIDNGYTGEIKVLLTYNPAFQINEELGINDIKKKYPEILFDEHNMEIYGYNIRKGDKIAQIIPIKIHDFPIKLFNELDEKERGDKGFGSSGS